MKNKQSDFGPEHIRQHGEYVESSGIKRLRNLTPDPAATYFRKKLITDTQFAAAEMFSEYYRTAGMTAHYASMKFNDIVFQKNVDSVVDKSCHARKEIQKILAFVGCPLADVLVHCCGLSLPLRELENSNYNNIVVLGLALDGLKKYWNL